MALELQLYLSEEEYLTQRDKQSVGTGNGARTSLKNFGLFCKDVLKIEYSEVIEQLRNIKDYREQESKSLIVLQRFCNWLSVDHPDIFMVCKGTRPPRACMKKDLDTVKGYVVQMRLYLRKVGGVRITAEDMADFVTYPAPTDKEEKVPMLNNELRKICKYASPKRSLMYKIMKDCEARIGAMVQLRVKHFDTTKRPIEVFFPKSIMKKKNGVSYSNTKYVTQEDEDDLLDYLASFSDPESLVWGTNENKLTSLYAEERYWNRLMHNRHVNFPETYKHSGFLKKSIHTIKAFTFTAAEAAVNETYAHAYGDHWRYTKNYLRWTDEEKIAKFRLMEPHLSLYTKYEKVTDSELIVENETLHDKLSQHDQILTDMVSKDLEKTEVKPDEKTRQMLIQLLKENNLI